MTDSAMMKIQDFLTSDDLRLLTDIGFIAGSRGIGRYADAIFEVIKVLRPEQEAGFLGGAMIHVLSGNTDAALEELRKAPETPAKKTFMGIALIQGGRISDGRELLLKVASEAPGTSFSKLAQDALVAAEDNEVPVKVGRLEQSPVFDRRLP